MCVSVSGRRLCQHCYHLCLILQSFDPVTKARNQPDQVLPVSIYLLLDVEGERFGQSEVM